MLTPARLVSWIRRLLQLVLLPGFALCLLAALWVAVFYQVAQEQRAARNEAVLRSQALARVLSEHVSHILRQADHATQLFKLKYEETGGQLRLPEFTRRGGLLDSVLPARLGLPIALVDRNGKVVDSVNAFIARDVAIAPWFRTLAENPGDAALFGTPLVDARNKKWQIQVTRRLNDARGEFAGMVVMMIDPAFFIDDYDRLSVDDQGALLLLAPDAGLAIGRVGEDIFLSDQIDFTSPPGAAPGGEVQPRQPLDKVRRIYGASDMPRFTLVAVVGMTEAEALATFERHRRTYVLISLAATFLIVLIVALLMRQSAALRRSIRQVREAQTRLRGAVDASLDAFVVLKAWPPGAVLVEDFVIADINGKGAAMLRHQREELLGRKAFEMLPRYRQTGFFDHYVEVFKSGVPLEEEVEVHLENEPPGWLHHQIVKIDGGVAVTSRDITARKQDEMQVRANRSFLQSLVTNLPLLIYVKHACGPLAGTTMVWNKAAERITGFAAERVIGHPMGEVFPPGFGLSSEEEERAMVASAAILDQPEKPIRLADGSLRYLHAMSVPLLDEAGQVEYILCIAEDITRRREQEQNLRAAEKALRESESRLRTVADTMPAMVAYIDAGQVYRFNNRAYEREFGGHDGQMLGKTIRDAVGERRYAFLQPYIERVLRGETQVFEEYDDSDGKDRALEVTYIPQAGDNGSVAGFHVMRQDITSQKREKKRLLKLSQIDALTELANRAGFMEKLDAAMQHSAAQHRLMAVMYMDIDHFKPVNDTWGHNVGDALLKAFAARLVHNMRAGDTIARLGGDEFTIIMEHLHRPEDASGAAAKIVEAMQKPFELDGTMVSVSASIGVAYYSGGPADAAELLRQADMLLYESKQAGRNTWRAGDPALSLPT